MKIIITLALVSFFGVIANAQNNPAPEAQPAQPVATTPAQPAAASAVTTAPVPAPAAPVNQPTLEELKKKHIDAVAELKKKHIDEITALKASLKGKSPADIRKAIAAKKVEQKAALKELGKANKAEIEQFRKDHPKAVNEIKKKIKF